MPVIDVVSDANLAVKWFHSEGEEEVTEARALLSAHRSRRVALSVLDLTTYEVGSALLRGGAQASSGQVATVLDALATICPAVRPTQEEFQLATELVEEHDLTIYGAAYAAVAQSRNATLATLDKELLKAGLGVRPSELVDSAELGGEGQQ